MSKHARQKRDRERVLKERRELKRQKKQAVRLARAVDESSAHVELGDPAGLPLP